MLAEQLISYGSCQFPTLGFVVERFKAIQAFVPEVFHKIKGRAGGVIYGMEPLMQRAEVLENLSMLSVWRTGCERHGVMRTYVCTRGSQPVQLDHHPDFPRMRLYREQSTQGMQGDGRGRGGGGKRGGEAMLSLMWKVCGAKTQAVALQLFTVQAHV